MYKKADLFLLLFLALLSLLPLAFFGHSAAADSIFADITVDGKLYRRVPLTAHHGHEEILLQNTYGSNRISIDDASISITEADCPDGLCIAEGTASRPGDVLVCLPHKLMIEVKGTGANIAPDIIPAK